MECAAPRASVLSAAREPQQRENRNVSKRRDKTRLFCCAVSAPHRRALFRAVSCEARVLSRVLSAKALGVGEFASVGKQLHVTECGLKRWDPSGQGSISLAFWTVPELLRGHSEASADYHPVQNFSEATPKHRLTTVLSRCAAVPAWGLRASRAGVGGVSCTNTQPRHVPCRQTSLFLYCPAVLARKWPQCSFLACRSPERPVLWPFHPNC